MNARWVCAFAVACGWFASSAHAQYHTQRGAVLGGLTGAAAGAAIGNQNGETAEGALIGSAIGLFSGALIGNSIDAEQSQRRYNAEQQYIAQNSRAVTVSDVLSMSNSGVSDGVMINHIQQHGVRRRLEVSDVILLHQQGVSEPVLTALQRVRVAGSPVYAPATRVYAPPVIVHDYYVPPAYPVYVPRYHHHHHYGRHYAPGVSWGFSVGR